MREREGHRDAEPRAEAAEKRRAAGRSGELGRALAALERLGRGPGRRAAGERGQAQRLRAARSGGGLERRAGGDVGPPQHPQRAARLDAEAGGGEHAAALAADEARARRPRRCARQLRRESLEARATGRRPDVGARDLARRSRGAEPPVAHEPDEVARPQRERGREGQGDQLLEIHQQQLAARAQQVSDVEVAVPEPGLVQAARERGRGAEQSLLRGGVEAGQRFRHHRGAGRGARHEHRLAPQPHAPFGHRERLDRRDARGAHAREAPVLARGS